MGKIIIILFIVFTFQSCADDSPSNHSTAEPEKSKSSQAVTEAETDNEFNNCKEKLVAAQKLDVLYDLDWKPPKEPKVVVGPTFSQLPIDGKEGFVETVNCFLNAGKKTQYINFNVLDWRTGKKVGRYSYGKLDMD